MWDHALQVVESNCAIEVVRSWDNWKICTCVGAWKDTLKPYEMAMVRESEDRANFFSPSSRLYAVTYCEWLNFHGVPIFVVFVDGPIHEF